MELVRGIHKRTSPKDSNRLSKVLRNAYVKGIDGGEVLQSISRLYSTSQLIRNKPYPQYESLHLAHKKGETHIMANINSHYDTMEDELANDPYWQQLSFNNVNSSTVFLDGVNCCGKTFVVNSFANSKVSKYHELQYYNITSEASLSYILLNLEMMKYPEATVIDRSPISNLAFQFAYNLMNICSTNVNKTPNGLCHEYIHIHNLKPVLEYLNWCQPNIFILLDSGLRELHHSQMNRGIKDTSPSDSMKSIFPIYGYSQNASYAMLANLLNLPVIDLNYFRIKYDCDDRKQLLKCIQKFLIDKITKHHDLVNKNIYTVDEIPSKFLSYHAPKMSDFESLFARVMIMSRR